MSTTLSTCTTPSSSNASCRNRDNNTNIDREALAPTYTSVYLVAKPKLFNRTCKKLEDQLIKFNLFFIFQGDYIPKEKHIIFISMFINERAFTQIKQFLCYYYREGNSIDINSQVKDFNLFKEQIYLVFKVYNKPIITCCNIQRLK